MIKESTELINPIAENIPEELKRRPQWVVWRLEERDGKPTKVLYTPNTDCRASTTDLMTWAEFHHAMETYEFHKEYGPRLKPGVAPFDGIGFVFSSADPFAGVDLDDCRDSETGEVAPWARKIIDCAGDGYVEASPSGTGVHIIVEGRVRDGGMRKGPVEMYSRERFFTVTGRVIA